jgi:hypothetical protein
MARPLPVYLEVGTKRVFAAALGWPGWCRSGRDEDGALASLLDYHARYAPVAARAGRRLPSVSQCDLEVVERLAGSATTDFGAPGAVPEADRMPSSAAAARRRAALVSASWSVLDDVVASAPASLRKGPRGGGRDRDAIVSHVLDAEVMYALKLGVRIPAAVAATDPRRLRDPLLEALGHGGPPDSDPKQWPPDYAARRIAWHVLDHAWEIEDRSRPA